MIEIHRNGKVYRPIPGWGRYCVSADGDVWSTASGRSIKQRRQDGCWYVTMSDRNRPGRRASYHVARLVLAAWGREPEEWESVAHVNGDTFDNRAENLEWVHDLDTLQRGRESMGSGDASIHAKLNEADVLAIRRRRAEGESVATLARELDVSSATISAIARGQSRVDLGGPATRQDTAVAAANRRITDHVVQSLREAWWEEGLSPSELAECFGVSATYVRRLLRGARPDAGGRVVPPGLPLTRK